MAHGEELWQAYTPQGEQITGKGLTKAESGRGALHAASHLWVWRRRDETVEILLQHRATDKKTWPGYYDVSAAGHIDLGETPLVAALREAEEEIGLAAEADALELFCVHRAHLYDTHSDIIENEFQWLYGLEADDATEVVHDGDEVHGVEWLSLDELKTLIAQKDPARPLVPHGDTYFANLFDELERKK